MALALKSTWPFIGSKKDDFADLYPAVLNADAMGKAKRAGADTWEPPACSQPERLAYLKRWAYLATKEVHTDNLLQFEPSGLTDREMRDWYWGIRQESNHRILCIINMSYTKTAVRMAIMKEGLEDVLTILTPDMRESYDSVVKYLSD